MERRLPTGLAQGSAILVIVINTIIVNHWNPAATELRLVRAYKLTYEQSAATDLDLLKQVQEFGSDAIFAADNTITGGTSLPPYVMTYTSSPGPKGGPEYNSYSWAEDLFVAGLEAGRSQW